jgi:hypothetical protein
LCRIQGYLESKKLTRRAVKIRKTEDIDVTADWVVFSSRADAGLTWLETGRDGEGASNKAEECDE